MRTLDEGYLYFVENVKVEHFKVTAYTRYCLISLLYHHQSSGLIIILP